MQGEPWSDREVELAVADYFHMLRQELAGQKYNKSEHRRLLQKKLDGRSEGSIEMKHQNISAVLMELGAIPLSGYKGLPNYQSSLLDAVSDRLREDAVLDELAQIAVRQPVEQPIAPDFSSFVVERPKVKSKIGEERREWIRRTPIKRDYLEREAKNRSLGLAGELMAIEFEVSRLHSMGRKKLADRVEHVASTKGDGLGYDILSFEPSGKERFIEVKTTAFVETTPFFISHSELRFSEEFPDQYCLYRLFDFRQKARMFELHGPVNAACRLDAQTYRASLL